MNRLEHLQWCKNRALEYCDSGDLDQAWASIISDLNKHNETRGHVAIQLGSMLMSSGKLDSQSEMRKFINGLIEQ